MEPSCAADVGLRQGIGGEKLTNYLASESDVESAVATAPSVATHLTIVVPAAITTGVEFPISGILSADDGAIMAAQPVSLMEQQADGTFADIGSAMTDESGAYTMTLSESAEGTYYFKTTYAGGSL